MALVKYATAFVGIDSSVAHMTNAFDLPGVVVWGDTDPRHWGHSNNINLYKLLPCSPCYYMLGGIPCPYDHRCMTEITVDEVKAALLKQLERGRERLRALGVRRVAARSTPPERYISTTGRAGVSFSQ